MRTKFGFRAGTPVGGWQFVPAGPLGNEHADSQVSLFSPATQLGAPSARSDKLSSLSFFALLSASSRCAGSMFQSTGQS